MFVNGLIYKGFIVLHDLQISLTDDSQYMGHVHVYHISFKRGFVTLEMSLLPT